MTKAVRRGSGAKCWGESNKATGRLGVAAPACWMMSGWWDAGRGDNCVRRCGGTVPASPAPLASRPFAAGPGKKTQEQQLYTTAAAADDDHTLSQRHVRQRVACMPHLYWRDHAIPVPARSTQVPEDARSIKKFCNNPSINYYYLLPSFVILNALMFFVIKRSTIILLLWWQRFASTLPLTLMTKITHFWFLISLRSISSSPGSHKNVLFFSRPHTQT